MAHLGFSFFLNVNSMNSILKCLESLLPTRRSRLALNTELTAKSGAAESTTPIGRDTTESPLEKSDFGRIGRNAEEPNASDRDTDKGRLGLRSSVHSFQSNRTEREDQRRMSQM